jgi:hypothetical protein
MVGDYISTSWLGGKAYGSFPVAQAPSGGFAFDQALYVPAGGLTRSAATTPASSTPTPVPGASSDHAQGQSDIRQR